MEVKIAKMLASDAPDVKALEVACGLSPWNQADIAAEAARADSLSFTAKYSGSVVGLLIARLITSCNRAPENPNPSFESEIYNLAVDSSFRRNRIAAKLLNALLSAVPGPMSVFLEVREGNAPAIAFYRQAGFEVIGRRPAFYRDPEEAAILMLRPPV